MSLARRVADRWEAEGVAWDEGADPAQLDQAEEIHGIRLPTAFRELWMLRDGTGAPDRHWLIFMQASDLVQPLYATRSETGVDLMFADWRQGTAVVLALGPHDCGVARVDGEVRRALAPSFDAFLEAYLSDSPEAFTARMVRPRRGPTGPRSR
ncbi:MAG: SMI1/KNR4 family protein [Sandaracinaceae bacterium]